MFGLFHWQCAIIVLIVAVATTTAFVVIAVVSDIGQWLFPMRPRMMDTSWNGRFVRAKPANRKRIQTDLNDRVKAPNGRLFIDAGRQFFTEIWPRHPKQKGSKLQEWVFEHDKVWKEE